MMGGQGRQGEGDGSLFGGKMFDLEAYLAQQHGHDGKSQRDDAPHIK